LSSYIHLGPIVFNVCFASVEHVVFFVIFNILNIWWVCEPTGGTSQSKLPPLVPFRLDFYNS
jgi:hypothetical protein